MIWLLLVALGILGMLFIENMTFNRRMKELGRECMELMKRCDSIYGYVEAGEPYGRTQAGFKRWIREQEERGLHV